MEEVTILWAEDEYNGPVNGIAEYNGKKIWFSRNDKKMESERIYDLFELSDEDIEKITNEHRDKCEKTGIPLNYGDPFIIKRRKQIIKMEKEKIREEMIQGEDSLELKHRSLSNIIIYNRPYSNNYNMKFMFDIKESQIKNYNIPHIVEYADD